MPRIAIVEARKAWRAELPDREAQVATQLVEQASPRDSRHSLLVAPTA
jgi:hypothetical protein